MTRMPDAHAHQVGTFFFTLHACDAAVKANDERGSVTFGI